MPFLTKPSSLIIVVLTIALAGCSEDTSQPRAMPPPVNVAIVQLRAEKLPVVTELPGRIAPTLTAEVRPRVTGIVQKRAFEQGSKVAEGELLYVIDPDTFQARVASAKATLDSALAAQILARQRAERQIQLLQKGVTTQENNDSAVAALAQSNADVERARADLRTAELDLQFTQVRAPISGTIGRALVTEGALVSPTSDVLAVIQQTDPIYADFTQPADSLIALRNAVADGRLQADASGSPLVKLFSAGGKPYPHEGRLLFTEASVNAATGQVILRTQFPNPEMNLLPGMFVRARLEQAALEGALAVPEQAVQRDTAGRALLYVVGAEDKVEIRPVTLGWLLDGRWVVLSGVSDGDRIVVEGFQRIAPGVAVTTEAWTSPSLATQHKG